MKAILRARNLETGKERYLRVEGAEWHIENFYDEMFEFKRYESQTASDEFDDKQLKEALKDCGIILLESEPNAKSKIVGWFEITKDDYECYGFEVME
ncbi:hypothetical protein K8B29_14020 [Listeria monocytogenes]|uniref:Uncharacterized protein n=2 Tax=Listeria monocytogenes TaxID=1639 RepID=A0A826CVY8_LISMN|nr:hypothetical protein [Listeria monocytogenes]MDA50045.1 hypothetical protein [Listeria monocytogenes serotype 1/2b]EAA0042406.1 hypothetical protein [Listeria monocytogenes]EAA0374679.1 hypothetical protein [Listeria monocytogenes]EAC2463489.1 hypothetical protein [Listeria monocytogenes]EAC2566404.1 hypothetical protein [Listeria monocytogenes]